MRIKCGQSGQGQNGHFHFRIVSFTHYINIKYLYIVEDIDNSKSFWPNDHNDRRLAFSKSYVIPLQIPTKSHFPPILRNGFTTDL